MSRHGQSIAEVLEERERKYLKAVRAEYDVLKTVACNIIARQRSSVKTRLAQMRPDQMRLDMNTNPNTNMTYDLI